MRLLFLPIAQIAHEVYTDLGVGFSEDVYDRAVQVGLGLAGIEYESQKVVELKYRDHYVGEGYPDLLVHLGEQGRYRVEGRSERIEARAKSSSCGIT